jgi:hypothetical protein
VKRKLPTLERSLVLRTTTLHEPADQLELLTEPVRLVLLFGDSETVLLVLPDFVKRSSSSMPLQALFTVTVQVTVIRPQPLRVADVGVNALA